MVYPYYRHAGQLWHLAVNELNRNIEGISQRMLTVTLKTLETDGLVSRKLYPQIPPKVEYRLTELGESMLPAIVMLKSWAEQNMPYILKARAEAQNKSRQNLVPASI